MIDCFQQIRVDLSAKILIEARMDSAVFNEKVVMRLDNENIEFTQSALFERFPALKNYVNDNQDWAEYDDEHRFVELDWKPEIGKSTHFRFIAVRKKVKKQIKGPRLAECDMIVSINRQGNCWDNAPMESFFDTLKSERVYRVHFKTREQARSAIFEYIEGFYNRERMHTSIGNMNPVALESKTPVV